MEYPKVIRSGRFTGGHVQGIAVDAERGYIYFSFTTKLVKTDLSGRFIGSVVNLVGHLGCITYDRDRDYVYGSLECKHDAIGQEILERLGREASEENNFYAVRFDCKAIDRADIDAETTDVMCSVWLPDVVEDFHATDEVSGREHRYGCSGIDGTAYGPVFGESAESEKKIFICYGVYDETDRGDNDNQVVLQYSPAIFDACGKRVNAEHQHHSGVRAEERYFLCTGNTEYGIQNLEYDAHTRTYLVAVYEGHKAQYPNDPLYLIDAEKKPVRGEIPGRGGEIGWNLALSPIGRTRCDVPSGNAFPLGQTGVYSFGDGRFYFSEPLWYEGTGLYESRVELYRFDPECGTLFVKE